MNMKQFSAISVIAIMYLIVNAPTHAATFSVNTLASGITDNQGPATAGSLTSISTDNAGYLLSSNGFAGFATANATANSTGLAAVSADGFYACGVCSGGLNLLTAESLYQTSFTNTSASSVNFTYDFFINGPSVKVTGSASENSGLRAYASAGVSMSTSGGLFDKSFMALELTGGIVSHTILSEGGTTSFFSSDTSGFGYMMADFAGSFTGILGAGESVTFDTNLLAEVTAPGIEVGARASVGDPNNLTITPGATGNLTISAVPVPAAVWLFGSGLLGLAGFARRK